MAVEAVSAPVKISSGVSQDQLLLTSVLRRVVGGQEQEYLTRLARVWSTADPEAHFRRYVP